MAVYLIDQIKENRSPDAAWDPADEVRRRQTTDSGR